jgi:DNA-binding response OmpR family regulator
MRRVLVVERDSLLRALIAEWLAAAGAEAIIPDAELPSATARNVEAIVVDVEGPRQAHEVLSAWRKAYPHAAIIAVSGRFLGTCVADDSAAARLGATRLLAKPFTRQQLWTALSLRTSNAPHEAQRAS